MTPCLSGEKTEQMTLTLLLDLDDTLLDSNMESFIPAYFQALSGFMAAQVAPEKMLPALVAGTRAMMASQDPTRPLREVFDAEFFPAIGLSAEYLQPLIDRFYDEVFPSLGLHTRPRPEAITLVEWALERGYRLVVATDPFFPLKATQQRMRWAGLPPEQYPFALVSSYETFHFTKSHPAYFAEVLARLGWPAAPVLMVGNDVERDLAPARRLGLPTYWIIDRDSAPAIEMTARGRLADLRSWLESRDLSTLEPDLRGPGSILAVMLSTPAALSGLLAPIPRDRWTLQPRPGEWGLTEILCHLRDSEREVNLPRLKLLLEESEPFLPAQDTDAWAQARDYIRQDGAAALREFTAARLQTLQILNGLSTADWRRKARHAIFGPTDLQELVGFIADHDRLHIQQAWEVMRAPG